MALFPSLGSMSTRQVLPKEIPLPKACATLFSQPGRAFYRRTGRILNSYLNENEYILFRGSFLHVHDAAGTLKHILPYPRAIFVSRCKFKIAVFSTETDKKMPSLRAFIEIQHPALYAQRSRFYSVCTKTRIRIGGNLDKMQRAMGRKRFQFAFLTYQLYIKHLRKRDFALEVLEFPS